MASPATPPAYEDSVGPIDHSEAGDDEVNEEKGDRKSGEWVDAAHPKLQVETTLPRWSEIEDTKESWSSARTRVETSSRYAPEAVVCPITPSTYAPEVVLKAVQDEKMEDQEEKIYSPEEKIAVTFSRDDKMLSPIHNEKIKSDRVDVQQGVTKPRRKMVCGLPWRLSYGLGGIIVVVVLVVIAVAATISVSKRNAGKDKSRARISPLRNPSMAALSWKDLRGVEHHKVYYQDESNSIMESAWNSTAMTWNRFMVADPTMNVQSGSPLGAAAGWPHANYSYSLVTNVYYVGASNRIYERQAKSNNTNLWANDNMSGLYSTTNMSSLSVYWTQNITNSSQALLVLFQEKDKGSTFSIGKYTSYGNVSNDWIEAQYNFTIQEGSPLSMVRASDPQDLLLYAVGDDKHLAQYRYNASSNVVTEFGSTDIAVSQKAVVTVAFQDNTPMYTWDIRPECSRLLPYTHLILSTNVDASSLNLYSWNCSSGFVNQTPQIAPLLQRMKRIFSLASHQGGKVYVRFDAGYGVQIEEWAVPKLSGDQWIVTGNVTTDTQFAKNGSRILTTQV